MSNHRPLPQNMFLDTSVFVAALFSETPGSVASLQFCADLAAAKCFVYYSQIARIEFAQAIRKLAAKADRLSQDIRDTFHLDQWTTNMLVRERWMSRGVREFDLLLQQFGESIEIPFSHAIWEQSVRLMASANLESLDAVQIATARNVGIRDLATTDAHFRRIQDPEIWLIQDPSVPF